VFYSFLFGKLILTGCCLVMRKVHIKLTDPEHGQQRYFIVKTRLVDFFVYMNRRDRFRMFDITNNAPTINASKFEQRFLVCHFVYKHYLQ